MVFLIRLRKRNRQYSLVTVIKDEHDQLKDPDQTLIRRLIEGKTDKRLLLSSGSSRRVRGGARNMKSMWPPLTAIFFMTYFHRARGPWPPRRPPLDPLLITVTGRV